MKPALFSFKLTVPCDPALADVVADVVGHAVNYAGLTPEAGAELAAKARAVTAAELAAGVTPSCPVVIAAADGELRITIGSQTISQPVSA
jgi:hypothetical protein